MRIVVAFAAGGPTDIQRRQIGRWLASGSVSHFLIENRLGAAGDVAPRSLRMPRQKLHLVIPTTYAIYATLYDGLNLDLGRDIAPAAGISDMPLPGS